ncbi:MAG: type II secretion system secretin GspD [Thermodesulfobacteriota bacterium]|nr:type II secretion system secretin GspD [Thermodesulfobacteriota bacterium]
MVKKLVVYFSMVCIILGGLFSPIFSNTGRCEHRESTVEKSGKKRQEGSKDRMITLNFDDVDIKLLIRFISELTGKNFVIDDTVKGKVTIISPTKITVDQAYRVFESVLEVKGYTAVPSGKIIKIIHSRDARFKDVETKSGKSYIPTRKEDKIITQLIPLEYADSDEIKKLLAPLVSKNSNIADYSATNTLIITDVSSNIHRLMKIIKEIDIAGSEEKTTFIPLEYASAETLSSELLSLFDSKGKRRTTARKVSPVAAASPIKIIPDTRTNSLIIHANLQDTSKIHNLIKEIDKPTPRGKDRIHVYYLENAVAEDMSAVLTKLPAKGKEKGKATVLAESVSITADKSTNSLIIMASPQDYSVLKEIIGKLDIMRSQVLVEALIAEVSIDKTKQLGIEWRSVDAPEAGEVDLFGGTSLPMGTEGMSGIDQLIATPYGASPTGLFLGAIKGTIAFGDQEFLNLGALIRAFQSDNDINILSTPHILTMDNEEAEIIVGEERPFLKTSQVTDVGTTTRTFEYKDLGITLRITPQISMGKMVKLKLFQEIKSFVEQIDIGAINTTKRQAKTTVIVEDGDTIVIGGLIRDDTRKSTSQVPCFGSIPILGWFFKSFYQSDTKVNLLVFVTPHIIKSPEDLRIISEEKRLESEEVKERNKKNRAKEIKENMKLLVK